MSAVYTIHQIEELFARLDKGEDINQVTAALTNAKDPEFCISLFEILINSQNINSRHQAALALRRRIEKAWIFLDSDFKKNMLALSLEKVVIEQSAPVRTAIAYFIASVGKVAFNEWGTQLLDFLNNSVQNGDSVSREVAAIIFGSLFSKLRSQLNSHFNSFVFVMCSLLKDTNPRVLSATFTAISELSSFVVKKDHGVKFREIIHSLIQIAARISENFDVSNQDTLVNLLSLLASFDETPFLVGPTETANIIRLCIKCAAIPIGDEAFSSSIVAIAIEVMTTFSESHPKIMTKEKLLGPIIQVLLAVAATPVDDDGSTDDDANVAASQSIDRIANSGAPRSIFKELTNHAGPWLLSQDPFKLRGALSLLCIVSEGCAEPMKRHCHQLSVSALNALKNENHFVRMTAAFAIAQFAEYLSPEFTRLHKTIVPALIVQIDTLSKAIVAAPNTRQSENLTMELNRCMYAVSQVVGGLSASESRVYLSVEGGTNLLSLASHILSIPNQSVDVMSTTFILVSALCRVSGPLLDPYSIQLLKLCTPFMEKTPQDLFAVLSTNGAATPTNETDILELVGQAITTVGSIVAASPTVCAPYIDDVIRQTFVNCERYKDEADLMVCNISFFDFLIPSLKQNFPIGAVQPLVTILLRCLSQDNLLRAFKIEDATGELGDIAPPAGEEKDEDEEARGNNNVIQEVIAALNCVQKLYWNIPTVILPLTLQLLEVISELTTCIVDDIVEVSCETLSAIVHGFHKAEGLKEFDPKSSDEVVITPAFMNIFNLAVFHIYPVASTAVTHPTASAALECLEALVKLIGPVAISGNTIFQSDVFSMIESTLKFKHPCQVNSSEDDENDDEEASSKERMLFDAICALTSALVRADRTIYEEKILKSIIPETMFFKFASHKSSSTLKGIGLAFFGELLPVIGSQLAAPFITKIADLCLKNLAERDDVNLLSDACFTLGICIEVGGSSHFSDAAVIEKILSAVYEILTLGLDVNGSENTDDERVTSDELHARDNALACLARIVMALPISVIPLPILLPRMLNALPLREDIRESYTILNMFRHLILTNGDLIQTFRERLALLMLKEYFQSECSMDEGQLKTMAPFVADVVGTAIREGIITKQHADEIINNGVGECELFTPELVADFRKALNLD